MKVLVAVEQQDSAKAIAEFVANHFWPDDTTFYVLNAIDNFEYFAYSGDPFVGADPLLAMRLDREQFAEDIVESTALAIETALPQAKVTTIIVDGSPKDAILRYADEFQVEMIIVGSHGRSGIERFFVGSVSLAVLSEARCSVLVVRMPRSVETKSPPSKKEKATV